MSGGPATVAASPAAGSFEDLEAYLARTAGRLGPLEPIELGLADALGLVLAHPVVVGDRVVLPGGRRVRPGDAGLLAAMGVGRVRCHPRPRIVVLTVGEQLAPAESAKVEAGERPDTNGPMLAALVRQADGVPFSAGIVADDPKALLDAFDANLGHADLYVASGGTRSKGERSSSALGVLGEVHTTRVALHPGGLQTYGLARGVPVFGLPDDPAGAFVSFELLVRPTIRVLQGRTDRSRTILSARLTGTVDKPAGVRAFVPVRLLRDRAQWLAEPLGSGVGSLAAADGLAEISDERVVASEGTSVRVHVVVDA